MYKIVGGNTGNHGGFVPQRKPMHMPPYTARCGACNALIRPGVRCKCKEKHQDVGASPVKVSHSQEIAEEHAAAKREGKSPEKTAKLPFDRESYVTSTKRGNERSHEARRENIAKANGVCAKCGKPFTPNKIGKPRAYCYDCKPYTGKGSPR